MPAFSAHDKAPLSRRVFTDDEPGLHAPGEPTRDAAFLRTEPAVEPGAGPVPGPDDAEHHVALTSAFQR